MIALAENLQTMTGVNWRREVRFYVPLIEGGYAAAGAIATACVVVVPDANGLIITPELPSGRGQVRIDGHAYDFGIPTTAIGNDVQMVIMSDVPTTLTYKGQTTTSIAVDATAATMQAALEALTNIGTDHVAVLGDPGGPFTILFKLPTGITVPFELPSSFSGIAGDVALMSASTAQVGTKLAVLLGLAIEYPPPAVLEAQEYAMAAAASATAAGAVGGIVAGSVVNVKAAPYNAAGNGITDDTAAIQAAVTAAKALGYPVLVPSGIYKLTGTIDARCTITGVNQDDDFRGIIGAGREATRFIQHTNNIPIFRFSGRYFNVRGFTAKFNTVQTVAQTAGNVFDLEDWIFFCTFDDLLIAQGYQGFNSKNGSRSGFTAKTFSNTFSNIRFQDNHYQHWNFSASTGNHMSNIYMGGDGVDRMYRAVSRFGGFEDVWNQLNIEQATFEDCAFHDTAGDGLIINALHIEGCRFPCGSGERAIVATDARGRSRIDIAIDECFFGPHKVSGITRSGATATATIDLLGKSLGGHGIRTGDTIVVSGANEAGYNVTATVTGVPTTTTVTYTVSGSPATPATIGAGNAYIQMSLGSALGAVGINIVKAKTGAEIIDLDVRVRDVKVTGNARDTTFKFAAAEEPNARVKLRNLSIRGQMDHAHMLGLTEVVALSRASNVATAYTRTPHRLRVGDTVFIDASIGGFSGANAVTAITGPHSFTYVSAGSDAGVAGSALNASDLIIKTFGTTNRARSSNVATLTLDATHNLSVGMRIMVGNIGGYTGAGSDLVISAVTSNTISYIKAGADEATAADTGGAVMVLDAGVSYYLTEPVDALVLEEADWLYSGCAALALGTVNTGAAATQTTAHYGVRRGDRIDWTPHAAIPDGLQVQASATANNVITWRAFNPTAGNIVSGVNLVYYKFSRG